MKRVDSDALGIVTKALGLTGRGAAITEFLDAQLDQTLDVLPLVRRGRTQAGTEGIFTGVLQNVHGAANSLTTSVNPYNIATGRIAPYPDPVPAQFDIWLLAAVVRQNSGTGTLSAVLDFQSNVQGWGVDDSGVAVVATLTQPLAFWDAVAVEGITFGLRNGARGPYARLGIRLPRFGDPVLTFRSTSSAVATFSCQVVLGVFPVSLGQDGLA